MNAADPAIRAPEDLVLAGRCAAGDRAAQRRLFQDHKQRVHIVLYRVLGSNRDMEDLVQEAFVQVFRSLRNYRGEAKLATWVDRIATRVAFAHLSRKRPAMAHLEVLPEIPANDASAERRAFVREAARRLYMVLDHLDPKYRVAFTLHVIDGRPLKEVAEMTESTVVATKTRVWRARREVNRRSERDPVLAAFLAEVKA